ncbi:MAG: tetratricopeptide repeat protein [Methanoregula sp.]|nr:tetratricopeptide repeat protein [Methanoregula sp.]
MKFQRIIAVSIIALFLVLPALAADPAETFESAGELYSKSVDLANEGKYQQALSAADEALAMNVTSLKGLIQSNRAGILVMLNRNDEAITAADAALSMEGNLTTVHSIAWYNKGNALRALGKTSEARAAYAKASELDPTLVVPDMPSGTESTIVSPQPSTTHIPLVSEPVQATPSATRTPLSLAVAIGAVLIVFACCRQNQHP